MAKLVAAAASALILIVCTPAQSSAQEQNRFALGMNFTSHGSVDDEAQAGKSVGLLWRIGHGHEGWNWQYGLSWYATDLTRTINGTPMEFGELRVRPIMFGYGYAKRVRPRAIVTADVIAGYAFTRFSANGPAEEALRRQYGTSSVSVSARNSVTLEPEIECWIDLSRKVGLNARAGYVISRPSVTITTPTQSTTERINASTVIVTVGLAYRLF